MQQSEIPEDEWMTKCAPLAEEYNAHRLAQFGLKALLQNGVQSGQCRLICSNNAEES
jgi:hypothetical protein